MEGIFFLGLFGLFGVAAGGVIALGWYGAAMVFGFHPPTSDQIGGLMCLCPVVVWLFIAAIFIKEGP